MAQFLGVQAVVYSLFKSNAIHGGIQNKAQDKQCAQKLKPSEHQNINPCWPL
jgi:hypothetical protein